MASRGPRAGKCPASGSRPAPTRTEVMRQAKTAALVHKEPAGGCPGGRTSLAKVGPRPADPKKVDFKRPGLTKAMAMRQKAAEEKIKRVEEAQRKIEESKRCPRRTPAPVGGDARAGRERSTRRGGPGDNTARLQQAISQGHIATRRGGDRNDAALDDAVSRGHITTDRRGGIPKRPRGGPLATATPIPAGAKQLAKSMNAKVVQAVPMSDGPVDKIIIEPGVVSEDRNTIVCISRPSGVSGKSGIANRSIQVIGQSLDQQDAAESAAVQGKLEELQHARREFVIAVANVGGNAVSIADENDLSILDMDEMRDDFDCLANPPRQTRRIVDVPDVSHEMLRINYGLDHPTIVEAREFSRRLQADMDREAAARRIEQNFEIQSRRDYDDMRLDVPLEHDIMEGDVSFEEDEEGMMTPCASRIKASMPPIPKRTEVSGERPITVEELQRFMDLEAYPPSPRKQPPPGREDLHRDLWDVEDPWYFEERQGDGTDLMRFDSCC